MKVPIATFFGLAALWLGLAISPAFSARFAEKLDVAVSRPWFPREATTPAAELELRALVHHCGSTWDGFAGVALEPCRLDCRDARRALLWSKALSESVCERFR